MHKSERKPSAGKAIAEELFRFVVWVSERIEKFPRSHKFSIGDRIQSGCLDLMELVVEATYTKDRAHLLRRAQLRRGGSWSYAAQFLRSAIRFGYSPSLRSSGLGFRVARTV